MKDNEWIATEVNAKKYLEKIGFRIIDENVNFPKIGELDIVAMDNKTLVFVEVRYRSNKDFGHPLETITNAKMRKTVRAAKTYLLTFKERYSAVRFDVIVSLDGIVQYYKNAFYGDWH